MVPGPSRTSVNERQRTALTCGTSKNHRSEHYRYDLDTVVVIADGATITSSTIARLVQQIVPSVKPALRGTDRYRTWRCRRGLEFDDRARESKCSRTATSENPRSRNSYRVAYPSSVACCKWLYV
jgi:hypothetical protein